MKYKIKLSKPLDLQQLKDEVEKGGRFIVYQYCISLVFAVTFRKLSPAIFIPCRETGIRYKYRYNLLSGILGWWGFPWGPIHTMKTLRMNNAGGIDVTSDVLLNITEESLSRFCVELKSTTLLFSHPEKAYIPSFKKAFHQKLLPEFQPQQLVVGLFLNVPEGTAPYYVIGIATRCGFDQTVAAMRKALLTQFYKHVRFDFIELDAPQQLSLELPPYDTGCLKAQGLFFKKEHPATMPG
ncbi:hypothetical protein [Niabella beijingensis]|uniref:hypothetical protein n=1 Tax=Niabella beijingensis TaxID=2872700 RepID=UPI001CBFB15C|nr:hypothetical protein [Niabella beijingensis]MBZ4190488.1 hypothetical protein [Niabella beijingensis]